MTIDDLNLSVRAYNVLMRNGITRIEDLSKLSESDISNLKGAGHYTTMEIIYKLHVAKINLRKN